MADLVRLVPNLSSKEFHSELKDWGYWKHQILTKYLRVWVSKLAYRRQELAVVDGFAGAGHYGDNPAGPDGSPVIAAKFNDHNLLEGKALIVHACETHPDSVKSLRANLAKWMALDPPRAFVYEASFEDAMPTILERTKDVPTLFFIDPCGAKDIAIAKLRPLLNQEERAATEILLRIDPVMLSRFAGWVKRAERDEKRQKMSAGYRKLLAGFNVDVDTIAASEDQPFMNDLLGQYLQAFYDRFEYVQLVPIRAGYFAAPKYYMVHGTDSPDGCAKVNDILSTTEDQLFEKTETENAGAQTLLFAPARSPRVTVRDAKEFVVGHLEENGRTIFIEICAALSKRFGPDLREKDHRKAVKELLTERKVVRSDSGQITRTTALRLPTALEAT